MKYSDRLRRGIAHWPRQSHDYYYTDTAGNGIAESADAAFFSASCALGAMVDPEGASVHDARVLARKLDDLAPISTLPPVPGGGLGTQIEHANDILRLSRESIADALEAAGY